MTLTALCLLLFACSGVQGPVAPVDDGDDVERPRPKPGKPGKPSPSPDGRSPDLIPAARGRLEKSTRPIKNYTPFRMPKKSGKCIGKGRYKFQLPGWPASRSVLVVPDGGTPRTLVVALHGGGGNAQKIFDQTRFDSLSILEGDFAVLAPEGAPIDKKPSKWNTGKWDDVDGIDTSNARDDVEYLDELVNYVRDAVCVDRVVVAGFSNGGQMAYRWACQGDEVDAAITSAGTLLVDPSSCKNQVPFRAYIGKDDDLYDSSPIEGSGQPNAVESLELMARQNGCNTSIKPEVETKGKQKCTSYQGCAAPTVLCVVDDYPHGWPAPWAKKKTSDCNATTEGWAWVEQTR